MITLNWDGKPAVFEKDCSLLSALEKKDCRGKHFAVMLNREFIHRVNYANIFLKDNDTVDIIIPGQGG